MSRSVPRDARTAGVPFGRYRLLDMLGRGGMGEVWRAFDTATDRVVALKVLPPNLVDDKVFQQRFQREARAAAGLNEPHVVPIHSFGETGGRLYVDMRLIDGRDLQSLLVDGPLEPARAVGIIEQIAAALHAAHRIGLVHRDVKPSNILIAEDDFAYLIDFGLARATGDEGLTTAGRTIGTWAYMAPERFGSGEVDERADIYALACVLYQALTGHRPFRVDSLEQIVVAHMMQPPPRPSEVQDGVSVAMDQVIATGMAKEPQQRYATTKKLAQAARAALSVPTHERGPRSQPPDDPTAHTVGLVTKATQQATRNDTPSRPSVDTSESAAEYKQVTVLFADVAYSMDIAVAVGAERFRELMAEIVERCSAVVQRYGGTVDKFIGDGIMALFGAPTALEDHALRACLAALGIQDEATRLAVTVDGPDGNGKDGIDVRMRIGLNSGEVIAGEIGSGGFGYTAVGAQVGMAQGMESVAPPGGVMLSESTARLVQGVAVLGEPEMVHIRGSADAVPAQPLLNVTAPEQVTDHWHSSLVGRGWELTMLTAMLDRSVAGRGAVVSVVGLAGVGKTRLISEAVGIAKSRGVDVFSSFCESHATDVPFRVVARLLRSVAQTRGLDDAEARARVRALIPNADPQDLALLNALMGIADPEISLPKIDPDARRRRLGALVNGILTGRAEPAIVVVEDLHWIDDASDVMLADFLAVVPQTHMTVLLSYRPEYAGALQHIAGAQTIALAPLSDAETSTLVAELLGPDPSVGPIGGRIAERAAGNPFFAQEIIRALAERGVLAGERGGYTCSKDVADVTVPASLQAAIAARIDRLSPTAKHALASAAVIGARFSSDLLAGLGVDLSVDELVSADLVEQVRFTAPAEYAFRHPLIRTVAYESRLKTDRARMHRRLVNLIEARDPAAVDESAALIAEHLEAAGEAAEAYGWHMRAAAWATSHDIAMARLSWERAEKIADALPAETPHRAAMRIAPRTMLCGSTWRAHADSSARFAELRELCAAAGDKASLAIGMSGIVLNHGYSGRIREASELASEAMNLIESLADPTLTVGLSFASIYAKGESTEWSQVLRWSQRVIDLADGDPSMGNFIIGSPLAVAFTTRALSRYCLGQARWRDDLRQCLAMARDSDPLSYARVVVYVYFPGISVGVLRPDDQALREIEQAVQIAERSGDDSVLAYARLTLGVALVHRPLPEERDRGQALLAEVGDVYARQEHNLSQLPVVNMYTARDRARDDALALIRDTREYLIDEGQLLAWGVPATGVLVETLLEGGAGEDLAEAEAAINSLADDRADEDLPVREIWLLRLRALLARARGDTAAYTDFRDRYRDRAAALEFEGHIDWGGAELVGLAGEVSAPDEVRSPRMR